MEVKNGTLQATGCQKAYTFDVKATAAAFPFFFGRQITISAAKVYFTPSNGATCMVFEGSYPIRKGWTKSATAFANNISYDICPGGSFNTQGEIVYNARSVFFSPTKNTFYSIVDRNSFYSQC